MENFTFYSSLFERIHKKPENQMIPLQGFFNFLRVMKIAGSTSEIVNGFFKKDLTNIEGVDFPLDLKTDTLEIRNGMNYAMFLEALLRIGYIKAEAHPDFGKNSLNNVFKNELEKIFTGAQIDMKKREKEDQVIQEFYSEPMRDIFYKYQVLLCAIFDDKAKDREATYKELNKEDFVMLIREAGLYKVPKPLSKEEEKKMKEAKEQNKPYERPPEELFQEEEIFRCIAPVSSFDQDSLDYFHYLECLLRVALAFPHEPEEAASLTSATDKIEWVL